MNWFKRAVKVYKGDVERRYDIDIKEYKEKKEKREPRSIETDCSSKCPFCGCTDIRGGSWSPDGCTKCKAIYFFGVWHEKGETNERD